MNKFRVWDKKEKEYVNDNFFIDMTGALNVLIDQLSFYRDIDTKRFIVERNTGLLDKKDEELYRNDWVQHFGRYGKIIYEDCCNYVEFEDGSKKLLFRLLKDLIKLGTIHEL